MNANASSAPLPVPLRSEAFAEDILEFVEQTPVMPPRSLGWLVNIAPLAVALTGVASQIWGGLRRSGWPQTNDEPHRAAQRPEGPWSSRTF